MKTSKCKYSSWIVAALLAVAPMAVGNTVKADPVKPQQAVQSTENSSKNNTTDKQQNVTDK